MAEMKGDLLKRGQVLFTQGERPRELYQLQSGSLEIISTPSEFTGLEKSIILSRGKRVGVISGKTIISGFSNQFIEPYSKSLRAIEDSQIVRYSLPGDGFRGIMAGDLPRAMTILKQLYNLLNISVNVMSKFIKLYQMLSIMNDNISLLYKEFSESNVPEDLHLGAVKLYNQFTSSGGVLPNTIDVKFLISDLSKFFEKEYGVPGGRADAVVDKKVCGFITRILKLDLPVLQTVIKADPGIAISSFEILSDNFSQSLDFIEQMYDHLDDVLIKLFSVESSWSQYFTELGGFDDWMNSGKISPDFIKNFLSLIVKINGVYEEISGEKLMENYHGIKKIHRFYMSSKEEKKAGTKAVSDESALNEPEEKKLPVFSRGGKNRSLNEIFEFALVDKEFKTRFLKFMNDFKNSKNPFSTESEGRKLRRFLGKLYWDMYKQVYIRSKTESNIPRSVKLMLNFGFVDEDLIENSQFDDLNELARIREKSERVPVLLENEFLNLIYTSEEEPSITEMGLDYRSYLLEQEKSRKRRDADMLVSDENIRKVMYEIDQRLASTAAVCSGSTATSFPMLNSQVIKGNLKSIYVSKRDVEKIVNEFKEIDFSVFYRETVLKLGEAREIIQEMVEPYFILLPIFGTKTLLWQELTGTNKRSRGRIVIPIFFMGDLRRSLAHTLACYRWELNRSLKGAMWADPIDGGISGEYFDYVNTFKKNSKLSVEAKDKIAERFKALRTNRDRFADDYLMWVLFEKDGIMKLNNVVREMFFKNVPFKENTRNKLESMPAFAHVATRYKNVLNRNIAAYERRFKKYQKNDGSYPEEIKNFFDFLKM